MAHTVVKIFTSWDGTVDDKPLWHLSVEQAGDKAAFCNGEFYGKGAGADEYETKENERGGITCKECLALIRIIKAVKI